MLRTTTEQSARTQSSGPASQRWHCVTANTGTRYKGLKHIKSQRVRRKRLQAHGARASGLDGTQETLQTPFARKLNTYTVTVKE